MNPKPLVTTSRKQLFKQFRAFKYICKGLDQDEAKFIVTEIYHIDDSKFSISCSLPVLNCYLTRVYCNLEYYSKVIESLISLCNHVQCYYYLIVFGDPQFFMSLSIPSLLISRAVCFSAQEISMVGP